jgi:hypothetical protein
MKKRAGSACQAKKVNKVKDKPQAAPQCEATFYSA